MSGLSFSSLLAVAAIALAAPILVSRPGGELDRRVRRHCRPRHLLLRERSRVRSPAVPPYRVRIGAQLHTIDADTGAAIIAAGLLTVVLFPPAALMLLSGERCGSGRDASAPASGSEISLPYDRLIVTH